MPLLIEYTISLLENEKIAIDFTDPIPSEYEVKYFLSFFRKYKREILVEHQGRIIDCIITPWQHWIKFLLELGFNDTAHAICEILNDLEIDRTPAMAEYIDQLKHAKIIKDFKKEKSVDKDEERYEQMKQEVINEKIAEKKFYMIPEKTPSELAFERDWQMLFQKYDGQWVAYHNGGVLMKIERC